LEYFQVDFNLDRLRTFVVVARTGNLSAAAKELGATQPNIGRQMAALEKEVRLVLFARHSRGLNLTKQGEEFLRLCLDIVGRLAQGTDIIRESDSDLDGRLRITTGIGTSEAIIENISAFSKSYPNLQFQFSSVSDIFRFHVGDADVGIIPVHFSDPELVQYHLFDMILRIYASPAYFQTHPIPKSLDDLQTHRLIIFTGENDEPERAINIHLNDSSKNYFSNRFVEANNIISLRASLLSGLGIGPYYYSQKVKKNNLLVDVFPDIPDKKIPYYFTYHKRLEGSQKIKVFHEFMKEIVKDWERPEANNNL
jgi:DNA-binding transcriptional LysR family regulator